MQRQTTALVSSGVGLIGVALLLTNSASAGPTYSYDALGRVISVRYDNGSEIRYQYDAAGNRVQHATSAATGNRKPVANSDAVTINESAASITFDPRANDSDPDSNPLTLLSVAGGDQGAAAITGGGTTVTYTTGFKRTAIDRLSYVISDGQGLDATGDIVVTLANLAPIAVNDAIAVAKNGTLLFDPRLNDTDPGGDNLAIVAKSTPAHGTLALLSDGTSLQYWPTTSYHGTDSFTYTIADTDGATANATVNVAVSPPTAPNVALTVIKNMAETLAVPASDADGAVTATAKTNGAKGTVSIGGGGTTLIYTPNTNATGTDSFTYTVSDSDSLTATGTVDVNILPQNTAPVAVNDSTLTQMNTSCQYVRANYDPRINDSDADGHPLTITGKTNGAYGTVTIQFVGTKIKYQRTSNFPTATVTPKSDTFTYTISDGHGGTATATITISVPYDICDPGGTN